MGKIMLMKNKCKACKKDFKDKAKKNVCPKCAKDIIIYNKTRRTRMDDNAKRLKWESKKTVEALARATKKCLGCGESISEVRLSRFCEDCAREWLIFKFECLSFRRMKEADRLTAFKEYLSSLKANGKKTIASLYEVRDWLEGKF